MTTTKEQIADRVKAAIEEDGYSVKQFADLLELSESQGSRLLAGKSAFRVEHLEKLGRILNMDYRRFLGINPTDIPAEVDVTVAAELANRHPENIRKALRAGHLKGYQQVAGGKWYIRVSDLNVWKAGIR